MRIAVIGASGGMGSFFVRYFLDRGAEVRASDPVKGMRGAAAAAGNRGPTFFRTNAEAVKGCDYTILAVPMEMTLEVAKELALRLKPRSTLVEMSSVKGETPSKLKRLLGERVGLLSIHPLFGPALESGEGMKIAVIVGKKGGKEEVVARRLFPEARVIAMSSGQHDRSMAVVLSLTHLLNVVYAGTVAEFLSPEEFMRVSTPNSSMQLTLAEAILAQDAGLSYSIQAMNPYSGKVARAASRELRRVLAMIEGSDRRGFDEHFTRLARRYETEKRASAVIREIYCSVEKSG